MVRGVERKEEGKGRMGRQEGRWKKGFLGAHWRIRGGGQSGHAHPLWPYKLPSSEENYYDYHQLVL